MLGSFWSALGGRLADRWAAASAPALVFWLGGLGAWLLGHRDSRGIARVTDWLGQQATAVQVVVLTAGVFGVAGSALVVQRLGFPVLRLLEGYWPGWLRPLRLRLVARAKRRALEDDADWQRLYQSVHAETPDADELASFSRLDHARRRRPNDPDRSMPTRIGNILRAAETWPSDKYGLDSIAVWPRLWLVLPDATRNELVAARSALDSAVAAGIWGLLFCAFAPWTVFTVPIGIAVAVSAVALWVPTRAELFGDLVEAAYDLHRTALYVQLRWPLPENPEQERHHGQELTSYLWRGSRSREPTFTTPP